MLLSFFFFKGLNLDPIILFAKIIKISYLTLKELVKKGEIVVTIGIVENDSRSIHKSAATQHL